MRFCDACLKCKKPEDLDEIRLVLPDNLPTGELFKREVCPECARIFLGKVKDAFQSMIPTRIGDLTGFTPSQTEAVEAYIAANYDRKKP